MQLDLQAEEESKADTPAEGGLSEDLSSEDSSEEEEEENEEDDIVDTSEGPFILFVTEQVRGWTR